VAGVRCSWCPWCPRDAAPRLCSSLVKKSPSGAVVATDPASVNADYDNGAIIHRSARFRGRYERAASRLEARLARRRIQQ